MAARECAEHGFAWRADVNACIDSILAHSAANFSKYFWPVVGLAPSKQCRFVPARPSDLRIQRDGHGGKVVTMLDESPRLIDLPSACSYQFERPFAIRLSGKGTLENVRFPAGLVRCYNLEGKLSTQGALQGYRGD
jgi:hypothetical protein